MQSPPVYFWKLVRQLSLSWKYGTVRASSGHLVYSRVLDMELTLPLIHQHKYHWNLKNWSWAPWAWWWYRGLHNNWPRWRLCWSWIIISMCHTSIHPHPGDCNSPHFPFLFSCRGSPPPPQQEGRILTWTVTWTESEFVPYISGFFQLIQWKRHLKL